MALLAGIYFGVAGLGAASATYGAAALNAAVSGAGFRAATTAGINLVKIGGRVAIDQSSGEDVFCALGKEAQKGGPQAMKELLLATSIGAGLGATFVLAPVAVLKAAPSLASSLAPARSTAVTTLATGGVGLGAFVTWKGGREAQNLYHQAWEAASVGDSERARALLLDAHKKALDASVDGVATLTGSLLLAKNAKQLKDGMAER